MALMRSEAAICPSTSIAETTVDDAFIAGTDRLEPVADLPDDVDEDVDVAIDKVVEEVVEMALLRV